MLLKSTFSNWDKTWFFDHLTYGILLFFKIVTKDSYFMHYCWNKLAFFDSSFCFTISFHLFIKINCLSMFPELVTWGFPVGITLWVNYCLILIEIWCLPRKQLISFNIWLLFTKYSWTFNIVCWNLDQKDILQCCFWYIYCVKSV